jgi:hypothetical protein
LATGCEQPTWYEQNPGDKAEDASGLGQLFERIEVPGITDQLENDDATGSAVWTDVNGDGLPDLITSNYKYVEDVLQGELRLAINLGCFRFESTPVEITPHPSESPVIAPSATIASADFNDDGLQDFIIGGGDGFPMSFLLSKSYDDERGLLLEDFAYRMGIDNPGAYVHGQISIADVNRDGWLDVAVGAEQISLRLKFGRPLSRLYLYQPPVGVSGEGNPFTDGKFIDIGGSDILEVFGGVDPGTCDPDIDKAVSSVLFRDLDDDGDLDLLHASQADVNPIWTIGADPHDPCIPAHWRVGVFVYENLIADDGDFRFRKIVPGSGASRHDDDSVLPEEGRMIFSDEQRRYVAASDPAISSYIVQTSDVDNDGDLDVFSITPTEPHTFPTMDSLSGKFWRNEGAWLFPEAGGQHGMEFLNWTYNEWFSLFETEFNDSTPQMDLGCLATLQPGACEGVLPEDYNFYVGDLVAADWDNDGWEDLVLVDRRYLQYNWDVIRNAYIRNMEGMFEPMPTTWSGISENMIAGEAVDIDGDGLLDLYIAARNGGSGQVPGFTEGEPEDQNSDRIYWNAGEKGKSNHFWLRVRLRGLPERKLLGAKILAYDSTTGELLGRKDYFTVTSYKTSHDAMAHFGLGESKTVTLAITLPDGASYCSGALDAGQILEIDVTTLVACD